MNPGANQMNRFFQKPHFNCSYQGEVDYLVGYPVAHKGNPKVAVRKSLWHTYLCWLNYPEQFWHSDIASVGLVRWSYCPWQDSYYHCFPEPEVAQMFPKRVLGRFRENWSIEALGNLPMLVATQHEFLTLQDYEADQALGYAVHHPILWTGQATEMTKAFWFEFIFPQLYPRSRSEIVQFLVRKGIEISPHPPIPNTRYLYRLSQEAWIIGMDRTYDPEQYLSDHGWIDQRSHAKRYYREAEAQAALGALSLSN